MGAPRGVAVGFLSLFLFLSATIFGPALTINSTVLNPTFVVSEIDKVDMPALFEETIAEAEIPEEFRLSLTDTVTKLEPRLKEPINAAIHAIYDYLLGKTQRLDLALLLSDTVLNADLAASLIDELDISSLIKGLIAEQMPEELEYLAGYVDDIIAEFEPWIKEQSDNAVGPVLDYLLGQSQTLNVVISLETVKESLADTLHEAFLALPPEELSILPPSLLEQYFDEHVQGLLDDIIPPTFEIDESMVGTELPAEIAAALSEAETALEEAKQYIGYFRIGYYALISFIALLIAGIILICRQVKWAARGTGIPFLVSGALSYLSTFIITGMAEPQLAQLDAPGAIKIWLPQLFNDFLVPLEIFSIVLMVVGVALLVVSCVYKPSQSSL